MTRLLALPIVLALVAATPYHSSVQPLSKSVRTQLKTSHEWHTGCPVGFDQLRVLTVTYWGFDGHAHRGQMVVNRSAAPALAQVFHRIYRLHFRIHHMSLAAIYGPPRAQPADGDATGSFECRDAVPSPCTGGRSTGHWSMHAYGLAVDINPVENPYVGCGQSRDPTARRYRDRSRHRRGMVTPAVVRAFRSVGWGWGGGWTGSTKDYMHFSSTGH